MVLYNMVVILNEGELVLLSNGLLAGRVFNMWLNGRNFVVKKCVRASVSKLSLKSPEMGH